MNKYQNLRWIQLPAQPDTCASNNGTAGRNTQLRGNINQESCTCNYRVTGL